MRTIRVTLVSSFALLIALYACSSTRVENGTDSTTHWLRRCDSAAQCGGLSCLCGVCNTICESDQECRGLDSTAVCMPAAASCTESERSCARGPDRSGGGDVMETSTKDVDAAASTTKDDAAGPDAAATAGPDASAPGTRADSAVDSGLDSADGDVELQSPEPSGAALLDRPSVGDYTCTVSRPASTLPIDPQSASPAVAELGGVGHVFWVQGQMFGYDGPLETAAVGLDGVLQTAHEVAAPDANVTSTSPNVRVVAAHDRLTLWWGYNTNAIDPLGALVQLDAEGNALAPSRRFDGTPYPYDATIAATTSGFVAAWGEPTSSGCDLTLLELDANADDLPGTRKKLTSLIKRQPTDGEFPTCAVQAITPTPNGYALIYERSSSASNIIAYQAFDAEGAPLAPATRLTPEGSWRYTTSLLAHGDQVLVAWSVVVGPNMNAHEVSATLRIARFGADGVLSGEVATLAAASNKQVDAPISFVDLGNELGLAWSRDQTQDLSCTEACLHSTDVRYVVLDAADLTPHSTPVVLKVTGTDNPGLGGRLLARNGDDLLVLLSRSAYTDIQGSTGSLGFSTPASAALHCVH